MMVLRLWDATTGALTFDSSVATGGVCLGFYTVPSGGGSITFPSITSGTGIVLSAAGGGVSYTSDFNLGYLRFVFPLITQGDSYVLFVK